MFQTLLDANILAEHISDHDWFLVDCRFDLTDTNSGFRAYKESHISGAIYADLNNDLSSDPVTDRGRHPLPAPETLRERFGQMGISAGKQVVVYDSANGAIASRLWWMLRYMGHEQVAVLDGGWAVWQAAGLPVRRGVEEKTAVTFTGEPHRDWLVTVADVPSAALLIDSRSGERYRGEMEPFDPVAGHIPGAKSYFYQRNWDENGRYLPAGKIRTQLQDQLGETKPEDAVFYCGSGVTACVNLLALAYAGMGNGRLYAGSWSDWSSEPTRPIATNSE